MTPLSRLVDLSGITRFVGRIEGGGSQPTDEVIEFVQAAGHATLPIVAADQAAGTVSVAGDQTDYFFDAANAQFQIVGSTGNDGFYIPASATYDSGSDRTVIDTGSPLASAVADGDVQPPNVYIAQKVLPPNSAVEWVDVVTSVEWDQDFYITVGDDDDPEAFAIKGGTRRTEIGVWQWPLNTLHTAASTPALLAGNASGYKAYPAGTTITVRATAIDGGTDGTTTVIVHHHYTEPVTATRTPPA